MRIVVTVREIMDRGVWLEFCRIRCINEWAVNEGLLDSDAEFTLTALEAQRLGLLPDRDARREA